MKKSKAARPPTPEYNYGLVGSPTVNNEPSMTKQSEAAACDVNNIVRQYDRTGLITHLQRAEAVFADVSSIGSYQDALIQVQEASQTFADLPSGLRAHFGNDPAAYVDWATQATAEDKLELYAQLTGADRVNDARPDTPTPASADKDGASGASGGDD